MNILHEKRKLLPMGHAQGGLLGGGGGGGQTTSTSYQTNIPEYARPYVDTMLGATQKQLFQTRQTPEGGTEITGFQPYRAFGGTYDEQGKQLTYDPSKSVAGFTSLQTGAQEAAGNLQVPGQLGAASDVTGQGIMAARDVGMQAQGLQGMGIQAAGAGGDYARMATDPYSMSAYMSPYMQNVVDVQQREARRASDISGQQQAAEAVGRGAFGGSRDALMRAERERNLNTQLGAIQAQGSQNAFQQAQQAQQFGANLGLQGLQAGAGMYGQGIGAQQAAINQALAGAGQLAGIGNQQLAAQQGIIGLQNQMGGQQQAYNQQVINQAIQDYANAQQYPLMQLGTMSNMLRGLPMQAQTTNQYVAQPNAITQGIGALGTYGSLKAANVLAEGGQVKSMAAGGITSVPRYDVGGEVAAQLENMEPEELERQARESSSPTIRRMAAKLLREKQMAQAPQGAGPVGPMGVDYQAEPVRAAQGGILAFYAGGDKSDAERRRLSDDNSGAPPAAEPTPGIVPTPVPAAAPPAKPAGIASYLDPYKADLQTAKEEAAQPESYWTAKAMRGIPEDTVNPAYRETLTKELANTEDEAKRQRYLRMAEMFATMGTMPGGVVMATLKSVQSKLPDLIADEQYFKKAKRELDKSIRDVDHAMRLEKAGYVEKGRQYQEKALDTVKNLTHYLIDAEGKAKISEAEIKSRADATAATRESTSAYRDANTFGKAMQQLQVANESVARVKGQIEREKSMAGSQYAEDAKTVARFENITNPSPEVSARLDAAKARMAKQDAEYEKRIKAAEDNAQRFSDRVAELAPDSAATKPAGGAPKTMTKADVAATAKAANKTEAEVIEQAKQRGIKIV